MIDGNVLRVADVEIAVDSKSLAETDWIIKRLDPSIVDRLAEGYSVKIGAGHPSTVKLLMVRSHVQNDWYMAVKKEIPEMVQKNHSIREDQIAQEASKVDSGDGTGTTRTPRVKLVASQKFAFVESLSEERQNAMAKIRGQRKSVLEGLRAAGGNATAQEVADEITKIGAYPAKTPDVAGSVLWHLKALKLLGLVSTVSTETAATA